MLKRNLPYVLAFAAAFLAMAALPYLWPTVAGHPWFKPGVMFLAGAAVWMAVFLLAQSRGGPEAGPRSFATRAQARSDQPEE
jgi:hypothetical protein